MKGRHENDSDTDTDTDTEDSDSIEVNVAKELRGKRKRSDKKEKECSGINVENLEGRHCELCGGGSDGKPPLIPTKDMPPLNELDGFSREDGWLGRLISPIDVDRHGVPRRWVHYQCILWSPEVHLTDSGSWNNVEAAITRGKSLKCTHCRRRGATLGCRIKKCRRTYHLACARFSACKFDHKQFLMACTKHLPMFQQPHSDHLNSNNTKNREFESNGDCDDDHDDGQIKDGKFGNIVPTFVGGTHSEKDDDKYFGMGGWESVGGLQRVIDCMKEVVTIPLLYPEFFESHGITPPRGVLLHGYPGTGKTHVVRALVGSCARGQKRIAYFSCKGADCLGKYVGDSEKHLKQLFQAAEECQPSIIFFDEIDGLVPSRNNQQQDQTHTSVVSTLLALLDGIKSRGCVVVIGATNRPNAIDSALRRPGRFDREIYFPLPSLEDRISILSLYTQKWPKAILKPSFVEWIGRKTPGFAGADLKALCTQTAMIALRRSFPVKEVLSKVDSHYGHPRPDLPVDVVVVEERDWLEALSTCPPPCSRRGQLSVVANDVAASPLLLPSHLISCLIRPLSTLLVLLYMEESICLPNTLREDAAIIESVVVCGLKRKKVMENTNKWWLHVDELLKEDEIRNEITRKWEEASRDEDCRSANEKNAKQRSSSRSFILEDSPGFCILIAGNPKGGQRRLTSYVMNSYSEHVEIRKLDLITLVSQGYASLEQGVAITIADFVSRGSCLIFMPRIDLWAIEPHPSEEDEQQCSSSSIQRASSNAWEIFTQQVELLCVSIPFVFLATSDVPFSALPQDIKKFFGNELGNCKLGGKTKYRMPRFAIQVDDSLKRDEVVVREEWADQICRHLAELFVVLVYQKYHHHEPMKRHKLEERRKLLVSEAISTLGREILQNPTFYPLCVVTSKFKLEEAGPCASVSRSEWEDLQFNNTACVVHELENHDDVDIGKVKGLVALALLASRGVYTTLQQVCSDAGAIRGVLVKKVNAKVEDEGKDRLRYLGVLSQGAWLQDVVDSWAYYYKRKMEEEDGCCARARDPPRVTCSIQCCSGCVKILRVVTRNILKKRIRSLKRFDGSTEGIHETVMRTWRKLAKKVTNSFVEGRVKKGGRRRKGVHVEDEYRKLVESYGMESCGCKIMMTNNNNDDDDMVICSQCHSASSSTASHDDAKYYKFVFNNNLLLKREDQAADDDEPPSFHCNYNTLCLASIIQPIAKKKTKKHKN